MSYYQVLISVEERVQGMAMPRALIAKRPAFGGSGGAPFLRENEVVENDCCYAITYTRADLKHAPTREAERMSAENVWMIPFIPFEGNEALVDLLAAAFKDRETLPEPIPIDVIMRSEYLPMSEVATRTASSFA